MIIVVGIGADGMAGLAEESRRELRRATVMYGSPRQLEEIKENSRCSTLFHLLVPGGKWHTRIDRPVASANFCSPTFHDRKRYPLLPPPSAVITRRWAFGYSRRPSARHQPRIEATAKERRFTWAHLGR